MRDSLTASSLVVAFFYADFGLAFLISRQMLAVRLPSTYLMFIVMQYRLQTYRHISVFIIRKTAFLINSQKINSL